jgi:hypothetical protein
MAGLDTVHVDIKPSLNPLCGSVRSFLLDHNLDHNVVGQHLVEGIVLLNKFVNIV